MERGGQMQEKGSGKNIIKFLLCMLYSIFFVACSFCVDVHGREKEEACGDETLSFSVAFSLQGEDAEGITLRAGRDFVLRLTVAASGEDFSGYMNVLMQNEQENHVLYQYRIEKLGAGESISCQMLLSMNLLTAGLYLTVTDDDGAVRLEREIPVEAVNYGQCELVAVYDPGQGEDAYAHFSSFGNQLVALSEAEMARGGQGMDALDIIVTQEAVLEELNERAADAHCEGDGQTGWVPASGQTGAEEAAKAQESLKEWVTEGRTLVVGASVDGEDGAEMLNLGLQEKDVFQEVILRVGNYEATRGGILAANEEIKKQYGDDAFTYYVGASMLGQASVNDLSNRAIALPVAQLGAGGRWWDSDVAYETLWQERGKDIVRCYHVGKGNVLVFAIPVTAERKEVYPLFYYRMAGMVLDHMTKGQIDRQAAEVYGYGGTNRSYLLSYIRPKSSGVSVFPYVAILMVYILVLIPAVFLLLRRAEKTKYLWGALPALAFFVMGVVYLAGSKTRLTEPYCSYIDLMDYTGGEGREEVNFSLSAPDNGGTQVVLKEGSTVRFSQTSFRAYEVGFAGDAHLPEENILLARDYRAAVCVYDGGVKLSLDNIRAFARTNFYAQAEAPACEGAILAEIVSGGKVVAGTIRNTTDMAFPEVYLCNSDFAVKVGGMRPGGEVSLEECRQVVFDEDSGKYYSGEFYGMLMEPGEAVDYAKRDILADVILEYTEKNEGETLIFALPEQEVEGLLGGVVDNAGSGGIQLFIWPAGEDVDYGADSEPEEVIRELPGAARADDGNTAR